MGPRALQGRADGKKAHFPVIPDTGVGGALSQRSHLLPGEFEGPVLSTAETVTGV